MMLFDRSDQLQRDVLRILTDTPGDPPGVYIPGSVEYHRAIELGMGWGAAPTVQIAGALADGRLVRFTDRHVDVPLYWQYWTVSSPLLTALTDYIADAAATHLDPVGHLSPQARAPR